MSKQGAGILFTDGQKILLLKRAPDDQDGSTWGLPGGGAQEDETAHETALRETKEECGLDRIPGQRFDTLEQDYANFSWTTFLYAVPDQFRLESLSAEHSDWAWFDLKTVQSIDLHPKLRPQMDQYILAIRRKFGKKFEEWLMYSSLLKKSGYNGID